MYTLTIDFLSSRFLEQPLMGNCDRPKEVRGLVFTSSKIIDLDGKYVQDSVRIAGAQAKPGMGSWRART